MLQVCLLLLPCILCVCSLFHYIPFVSCFVGLLLGAPEITMLLTVCVCVPVNVYVCNRNVFKATERGNWKRAHFDCAAATKAPAAIGGQLN